MNHINNNKKCCKKRSEMSVVTLSGVSLAVLLGGVKNDSFIPPVCLEKNTSMIKLKEKTFSSKNKTNNTSLPLIQEKV